MMTDPGVYNSFKVGYNFRLAKLLERLSGTMWWMSTLVSVEKPYRNKLTLYISQIKPHLIIITEVSRESHKKGTLFRLCVSLSKSAICTYIQYNYYHSATFLPNLKPQFDFI